MIPTLRFIALVLTGSALGGCVSMPAAISDVSADRVKVVQGLTTTESAVRAEAERACSAYGRVVDGPLSSRRLPDGFSHEVLFICRPVSPDCQKIGDNIVCPGS